MPAVSHGPWAQRTHVRGRFLGRRPRCRTNEHRMAQMCALLIATSLAATILATQDPPPLDRWTRARTAHFTILTDGTAADARRLALRFERLRSVFGRLWPPPRARDPCMASVRDAARRHARLRQRP